MKEFVFNKNDYSTYKDMYIDMAHKMGCDKSEDYYDTKTFDFDPNILWEYLLCEFAYSKVDIKIKLVNFDIEDIKKQRTYENYELNLILEVFTDFVKSYPNNSLEFKNE